MHGRAGMHIHTMDINGKIDLGFMLGLIKQDHVDNIGLLVVDMIWIIIALEKY